MGLDDATADRFAKQKDIKQQNNRKKNNIYNKDKDTKDEKTFNIPSCDLLGKILVNRFSLRVQLVKVY